ncbi:uncharacterized protein PRCAT00005292001 [Priceomyces carsonii]|uniref:uncharacterized protein n=1 Tax=Priceomyces carsonii TaxID=28549 RepID=UPI002EDB456E|nr:unnamed protein product [Priceomyces carsonii]
MTLSYAIAQDGTHVFSNRKLGKHLFVNESTVEVSDTIPSIYSKLEFQDISAIIGIIRLKINKYLILVEKHTVKGSILGNAIAKVDTYKVIPLGNHEIAKKSSEEAHYLDLLDYHLTSATLFFSVDNGYDLTNCLQKQFTTSHLKQDDRFWWNKFLSEELLNSNADGFVTPMIYGYFKSHSAVFKGGRTLDFALLTRRSVQRAGTRYFRRGIDEDGNVANFNETEQIFTTSDQHVFSFLQTRGSVPVYWSEINNLKYRPNLVISTKSSLDATVKHFTEQVKTYGEVYCVNLVNQSGYELPVKRAYEAAVENLPQPLASSVKYIYFDFHHECRKMRWDRVKLLLDHLIKLGFTSGEYFHFDLSTKEVKSTQTKIIRTNCMDCLDRTNVVQSTLGRWVLQNQLEVANYLPSSNVTPWEILDPKFNLFFQSFWADNADAVSCAYSGTGALKTDYTRTGKRTRLGALQDLVNSITRYYRNNYKDGVRQDAYDLFLGKYRPYQDSVNSPFIDRRPPYVQLLPYLMGTSLIVLLAILCYPRGSILDLKNILVIGGCLIYNLRSFSYLNREGYQFVNWPKLNKLDYLKKTDVFDGEGKFMGIRYEEVDSFKTVGKKRS